MNRIFIHLMFVAIGLICSPLHAQDNNQSGYEQCLLAQLTQAQHQQTVAEIKAQCSVEAEQQSAVQKRLAREQRTQNNRNVLTPHNRNYLLPFTYTSRRGERDADFGLHPGDQAFDELKPWESKFQLSLKTPLFDFSDTDTSTVYLAFTATSFWQVFNQDISAPFRETNYEPEIFWLFNVSDQYRPFADNMLFSVGASHQSNGRSQPYSRSWNRLYVQLVFEKDNVVYSFKPWWRLPETSKPNPEAPEGDDNPDIHRYMGNFEFMVAHRWQEQEFSVMLRNNLQLPNHGAIQLEWSFPLWHRLRGFVQYFNGYGESLIDYDQAQQRLGFGILLTDLL